MAVRTTVRVYVTAEETGSADLGTPRMVHSFTYEKEFQTGTTDASEQFDTAWSDRRSAAATPDDLDLRGGLTSAIGGAATFVDCGLLLVSNRSSTAAEVLTLGNDANAAFSGFLNAAPDRVKVGPQGLLLWVSPVNALVTTAGTADILQVDPGAATISYDVLLVGRSA